MGNQHLAWQIKRHDVPGLAPVINERCQGPGHIDESDIAHSESNGLVVMVHCRLAGELKDSEVMIRAIEANIPVRPLDPSRIGTNIQCGEPADVDGRTQPAKTFGSIPSGLYRPHSERSKSLHLS